MEIPAPESFSLPLFPLHAVLFPQFPIQLHVFEERYRRMIDACLESGEPFGITLIRNGSEVGPPPEPNRVGCSARIVAVKRLQDGHMDLLAVGERRFHIMAFTVSEHGYLIGDCLPVEDSPGAHQLPNTLSELAPLTKELAERFHRYLAQIAERAGMDLPDLDLPHDAVNLAFCVGSIAQLDLLDKQRLLEMTDTRARLLEASALLDAQIADLAISTGKPYRDNEIRTAMGRPVDLASERWANYLKMGNN